jgi:hypothetical protein
VAQAAVLIRLFLDFFVKDLADGHKPDLTAFFALETIRLETRVIAEVESHEVP